MDLHECRLRNFLIGNAQLHIGVAVFALMLSASEAQIHVTNRPIPPEERAAEMRDKYDLTSHQEEDLRKVYARRMKAEERRAELMRILTREQYSAYMRDNQKPIDEMKAQGRSMEEQLYDLRRDAINKDLLREVDGKLREAGEKQSAEEGGADIDKALATSPLPDEFAFSRLSYTLSGQFRFSYQPKAAPEKLIVAARAVLFNPDTKLEVPLQKKRMLVVCRRIASEPQKTPQPRRRGRGEEPYFHIYEFEISGTLLPEEGPYLTSTFFRRYDCLKVTLTQPNSLLPRGGTLEDVDFAFYDKAAAEELWKNSDPDLVDECTGSVLLEAKHATTRQSVILAQKQKSENVWSRHVRDPARYPDVGEPIEVRGDVPHLDMYCDYLMSFKNYKCVAHPYLLKK